MADMGIAPNGSQAPIQRSARPCTSDKAELKIAATVRDMQTSA
jgi:hypothetical protein